MKKYCLIFIFVFSTGLLFSQFTKTVTLKDGTKRIITKTSDKSLSTIYTIEHVNKRGIVDEKSIWKKDLRNKWKLDNLIINPNNKTEFIFQAKIYLNEKYELTKLTYYDEQGRPEVNYEPIEKGNYKSMFRWDLNRMETDEDHRMELIPGTTLNGPVHIRYNKNKLLWLENLKENTTPPPYPTWNDARKEVEKVEKKCDDKKVSIFLGPSLLNGDFGSDKESFFGGQVYASYNLTANLSLGTDISLHSKKDGDSKYTRSLVLARGQYDFFTGDNCDKTVIPEAHIVIGLGSESVKFTFDGDTSKFSASGLSYGLGAGVGIKVSENINIGLSLDYVGIKFKDSDSVNSNIRAGAGIKIGFGSGSSNNKKSLLRNESSDPIFW